MRVERIQKRFLIAALGRCRYNVQNLKIRAKIGGPIDVASRGLSGWLLSVGPPQPRAFYDLYQLSIRLYVLDKPLDIRHLGFTTFVMSPKLPKERAAEACCPRMSFNLSQTDWTVATR
jgi:hypothetical protein